MGKSVLLATMALQFRRYRGSRILAFDMGRSMRATILGLGGEHYDLGSGLEEGRGIAFQPLAGIDQEAYRTWAAEWIEGRLLHEGVAVGPAERDSVWTALASLASAPVEERTLTGLSVPANSSAISAKTVRNGFPDACTCRGFVVRPSTSHIARACRISSVRALSRNSCMIRSPCHVVPTVANVSRRRAEITAE